MALEGVQVVQMLGTFPGMLCGTILADFGATVTVVRKIDPSPHGVEIDVMSNGKKVLLVDIKSKEGVDVIRKLCARADVLIDPYRSGVMESLGLGPELLLKDNPRLIYARLTGFGQDGIYKDKGGHEVNFAGLSGSLPLSEGKPREPPVYLAGLAGGGLGSAMGILLALVERKTSGKGQIVDASFTAGAAYLTSWLHKAKNLPFWSGLPIDIALSGSLPYYRTYKTKDGKFMAVGALEPKFYLNFLNTLQLSLDEYPQSDLERCRKKFEEIFLTKTQDEWCNVFDDVDACVTPVLQFSYADKHELHASRQTFYRNTDGYLVPDVVPRLSRTPGVSSGRKYHPVPGQHNRQILEELGYDKSSIDDLINRKILYTTFEQSKL